MVLGFMFSEKKTRVVLIQKQKPEWQKGYLNGVGGKKEEGESPFYAMVREFKEETTIQYDQWKHCITFKCNEGTVFVYKGELPFRELKDIDCHTCENGEIIEVCKVDDLRNNFLDAEPLSNLYWMIPLLLDNIKFPIELTYNSSGGCRQKAEFIKKEEE